LRFHHWLGHLGVSAREMAGNALRSFMSQSANYSGIGDKKKRKDYSRITFNRARHEKVHGLPEKDEINKRLKVEVVAERKVETNPLLETMRREMVEETRKKEAKALAEASRSRKLLVCGDARGGFEKLFSMVDMQSKKVGPFDAVFCVGAFFARGRK